MRKPSVADTSRRVLTHAGRTSGAWSPSLRSTAPLIVIVTMLTGCAAMQSQKKQQEAERSKQVKKLQSRVEQLERQNGRLTTRIDELEDDIFLLQDRVEAHRMALKRQRQSRQRPSRADDDRARTGDGDQGNSTGSRRARRPEQPPRTQYQPRRRETRREVTRIPLNPNQSDVPARQTERGNSDSRNDGGAGSQQSTSTERTSGRDSERPSQNRDAESEEDTIVITNEDFEQYSDAASDDGGTSGDSASADANDGGGSDQGEAQPRVTDETLETSDNGAATSADESSSGRSRSASDSSADPALSDKDGLDLYKAALSLYRQGDYGRARRGFQSFMEGDPRRDYQDNGLYWIGECEFGLGNHQKAISMFERVIEDHPDGNKVPDAMLKMALAHRELGNDQRATELLEKVASQYPRTNVGDLAERKMK